jgi:hypothetical protein
MPAASSANLLVFIVILIGFTWFNHKHPIRSIPSQLSNNS